MGEKITVWTRQHIEVWKEIEEAGRYTAKKAYIDIDLEEHAPLVLEVYDWLVEHTPTLPSKPKDAEYPVWVSLKEEATMMQIKDSVILELTLDKDLLTMVNIDKWGMMLNYSYIPQNEEDAKVHSDMLKAYRISDTAAYMSQFYPQIKREIRDSWYRLFDDSIILNNSQCYGNIWEVRKEWVTNVIR